MTLRFFLMTILTAASFPAAAAQDVFVSPWLGFFEAGVICGSDTDVTREAPDTVTGTTHVIDEAPPFISNHHLVPAVIGIGFGVRAGLLNDMAQDGITMHISHPPFAGNGTTEQSFITTIGAVSDPSITFYQFDFGYELALGDWTMTASRSGVTLYEATFTVVPPADLPDLAGACGYFDLLG